MLVSLIGNYGSDFLQKLADHYKSIGSNGGVDSTVELKFVDECCSPPLVYTFNIKRENIEWCSDTLLYDEKDFKL